jgi:hypothetical protein
MVPGQNDREQLSVVCMNKDVKLRSQISSRPLGSNARMVVGLEGLVRGQQNPPVCYPKPKKQKPAYQPSLLVLEAPVVANECLPHDNAVEDILYSNFQGSPYTSRCGGSCALDSRRTDCNFNCDFGRAVY